MAIFLSYFILCCLAMPELLRSAKLAVEKGLAQGRGESYVKQLTDYIIPALVEALHKVIVIFYYLFLFVIFCFCIMSLFFWWHLAFFSMLKCSWTANGLQEPETEICASMLDSLNECVQVCHSLLWCSDSFFTKLWSPNHINAMRNDYSL